MASALLVLVLLLAGCSNTTNAKPTSTKDQNTVLGNAAGNTDAATTKADAARAAVEARLNQLLSSIKSNVTTARGANKSNSPGPFQIVVDSELSLAEGKLAGVDADPAELAAGAQRRALVEQGKAEEARAAYDKAQKNAENLSNEVAVAKAAEQQAISDRDAARAAEEIARKTFIAQLAQNQKDNKAAIDKLKRDYEESAAKEQAFWLNIGGTVCILIFAAGIGIGKLKGLEIVWPFGLLALIAFGLAQIVMQAWFKWAVLSGVVLIVGAVIWWIVRQYKTHQEKEAIKGVATQLKTVVDDVVPTLELSYKHAPQEVKDVLDEYVFTPLDKRMDKSTKAFIKTKQAELPVT